MNNLHEHIYFYIDETYKEDFLGVAIVVLLGEENIKITKDLLSKVSNDPVFKHFNNGSDEIHYVDNTLDSRKKVIDTIYQMPISVYSIYKKQDLESMNKQQKDHIAYKELFPELLKNIAIKYKKIFKERPITINLQFEQLSDKKGKDKLFFMECISNLDVSFNVNVVTKENVFTALPDYFLAFFRNLVLDPDSSNWPKKELELVESKIGLVIDATGDQKRHYGRGDGIREFILSKH